MKSVKISMAVAASALLLSAPAMAFHDGGVAKCEGCHTMHNSLNNVAMTQSGGPANTVLRSGPFLLQGGGQASDACLNCHESATAGSYKVSTTATVIDYTQTSQYPVQKTPGGDFAWLKVKSGLNNRRGHNILGTAHNYIQEPTNNTAPGGTYPASNLQCSSCHDPHGKYRRTSTNAIVHAQIGTVVPPIEAEGSYGDFPADDKTAVGVYRILAGKDYLPKSQSTTTGLAFVYDPPTAIAPNSYNRSESASQTRVAYGKGMSEWCANCHAGMLNADGTVSTNNTPTAGLGAATTHVHPAGNNAKLGGGFVDIAGVTTNIADNYNAYKSSGNLNGAKATAFDSLVPFETGDDNIANLTALVTSTAGPDATANVMCLSCHRAHATGFDSMLRYEIALPVTTDATGTTWNADAAVGNVYKTAAYNGKPASIYGAEQRVLCNKCHAKD